MNPRLGYALVRALPRHALTTAAGRLAALRVPPAAREPLYAAYAAAVGANLAESGAPLSSFGTFNAFFARPLAEGARPIDESARACAPVDGRVDATGLVTAGRAIQAKGIDYAVADLVGDAELASALEAGPYVTLYLSPADYHRVHAPLAARVARVRHIPGALWPVNGLSVPFVDGLFRQNERVVFELETSARARVAVVMVAATIVGAVRVNHPSVVVARGADAPTIWEPDDWRVTAGAELGAFLLGSTVIVVAPRDFGALMHEPGARLRVGQRLWA